MRIENESEMLSLMDSNNLIISADVGSIPLHETIDLCNKPNSIFARVHSDIVTALVARKQIVKVNLTLPGSAAGNYYVLPA